MIDLLLLLPGAGNADKIVVVDRVSQSASRCCLFQRLL